MVFKRPFWTCQESVGNVGMPKLAWEKVQAVKVSKRSPRIQRRVITIVRENFKCQWGHWPFLLMGENVTTPLWSKCEDETHTPKSANLKSSRTPEKSELDYRGHNTSPWGVFYTVGNVLKCRCWKWPLMSHLDICSTSYDRMKGRESNWQFDSWPLKVGNQPDLGVQMKCGIRLERSWGELQVCFRLHPNQRSELGVMSSQSPGSPNQDNFWTPPWESQDKKPFGCRCHGQTEIILYGGKWWHPPSLGRGESSESVLPMACLNT
jgi:hypothetical protein